MIISAFVGAENVWSLRGFCIFDIQKPRRPHRHNDIIVQNPMRFPRAFLGRMPA
jgi:hypothetical protein